MVNIDEYLSFLGSSLSQLPLEKVKHVIQILHHARLNGKQVFIMGNGGSASTSSHFVCDLAKNNYFEGLPPFRAIDLNSSNAIFTAYSNDDGYDNVFAYQLRNLVQPNDIVIAISTSGNSPNILKAIKLAKRMGAITIGFTGYEGGKLAEMVNVEVRVESENIRHIEDIHMIISHLISFALYEISSETLAFQIKTKESFNTKISTGNKLRGNDDLHSIVDQEMAEGLSKFNLDSTNTSMLFQLLRMLLEITNTKSGTLIVMDESGQVIDGAQVYGGKTISPSIDQLLDISKNGLAGWVLKNQQAAIVESTSEDSRWLQRPWEVERHDSKSALSIPIKAGNIVGCITLVRPKENRFSIKDLELVTNMTSSMEPAFNKPEDDQDQEE
jgi:D-sedoheptulose 7-phosphate isomerase